MALGLCRQSELDSAVQKAAQRRAQEGRVMSDDERRRLVSTEQSLASTSPEPRIPTAISGLETFTLSSTGEELEEEREDVHTAESLFNLPDGGDEDEEIPDELEAEGAEEAPEGEGESRT